MTILKPEQGVLGESNGKPIPREGSPVKVSDSIADLDSFPGDDGFEDRDDDPFGVGSAGGGGLA